MLDALQQLWQRILEAITQVVIPDWNELIALMPYFLLLGVAGPILSLLVLGWVIYVLRKPRTHLRVDVAPIRAQVVAGKAEYPAGEPYCPVDQLIYPFGTFTCDVCRRDLLVRCPKCSSGRLAHVSTCGNGGLVLKIENRARALQPAGPPPGGAAAA